MTDAPKIQDMTSDDLVQMIDKISAKFVGQSDDLESAIGMLFLGRAYGWKMLYLVHSRRTMNKYADILKIDPQQFFPAETELSERSVGYKIARSLSNFWKAVKGEYAGKDTRSKLLE